MEQASCSHGAGLHAGELGFPRPWRPRLGWAKSCLERLDRPPSFQPPSSALSSRDRRLRTGPDLAHCRPEAHVRKQAAAPGGLRTRAEGRLPNSSSRQADQRGIRGPSAAPASSHKDPEPTLTGLKCHQQRQDGTLRGNKAPSGVWRPQGQHPDVLEIIIIITAHLSESLCRDCTEGFRARKATEPVPPGLPRVWFPGCTWLCYLAAA